MDLRTILLVDDYQPNLRMLEITFNEAGFRTLKASQISEAKELLSQESCDLVLSDIQMPGGSGFDLLVWMSEQAKTEIPVLLITSALPNAESRIKGLSLGAVDYVERSLGDDELVLRVNKAIDSFLQLKQLKASLADSEKLASLGRIISASHHEVKNLASIISFSAHALERKSQAKDSDLDALIGAASMLADITKSLGFLLRDQPMPSQCFDLKPLVEDVVAMTRSMFKSIALDVQMEAGDFYTKGSVTGFRQVLLNLLLNARDAIEEKAEKGGHIVCRVFRQDGSLLLSVRDNGAGFSRKGMKREFPAFASTKTLRGGTGLGLWYSHRVLSEMNARLELASEGAGLGATATVIMSEEKAPKKDLDISAYLQPL